ncbi:MAG: F0F1 ATP synthase subunit delta [Rhodospirillaceae bacterium]|nr:F0F1 ATP synthase subunit delta [Rhodospirillaceae bacterium]MBT3491820.1 F0F1 ATP synthase subunit delta [Rhodospirillaceae bacterium]MBT3783124.1 F0F1 ATP synthase subunit delta [Rhodospirillaceae bacterium]MBT3978120.1 F0F1 ATP synthase subunit delta [Rhodospirillaceae bacterium]MBT4167732.1 F0F1 ATP synthase subunit delta [Rhodospirillaceae bacterium]
MSAEASVVSGIAGRYATALFELARDNGVLDQVASDASDLGNMIEESDDLGRLLRSPVIAAEDQGKGIAAVLEKAGASEMISNFVAVVAQNRRLFALRDMVRAFRTLLAAHRGEVVAEVTSAKSLNDEQLAKIKAELTASMKTDVQVETAVDERILGGIVVKVGSRMVDSSLRTKIQNLRFAMRGVE